MVDDGIVEFIPIRWLTATAKTREINIQLPSPFTSLFLTVRIDTEEYEEMYATDASTSSRKKI